VLTNPDARRGLRTVLQAGIALLLVWLVWELASRITDSRSLLEVIRWSLSIVGLGTLGYIMENSLRAIRISFGKEGAKVEVDGDDV
jgi:hypothetical protein